MNIGGQYRFALCASRWYNSPDRKRRTISWKNLRRTIFDPDDLLHFIELDEFIDDWRSLGLNDDADLFALRNGDQWQTLNAVR